MPICENCGAHVTPDYVRVFAPDPDATTVRACPWCPDMVRDQHGVRDARSDRGDRPTGAATNR